MSVSAYMIAHCDDDYLNPAIDSIIDHVDELIFVDGAYGWVAPFLPPVGIDPQRSWPGTFEKLARYGSKIKYYSGIWKDELEKRAFGFSKCRGDFIIRIDADEIFCIDDEQFRLFRKSGKAVADMEFPYLVSASAQRLEDGHHATGRQVCMFRRRAFRDPLHHCSYLWLVLTEAERQRCRPADWKQLYPHAVSQTAHLTALRTPRSSVNRARFYTLQHIRTTGQAPFGITTAPGLSGDDLIRATLDEIGAETYGAYLEGHQIVSGFANMHGFHLAPYAAAPAVAAIVDEAVATHARSLAELLDFQHHPRVVLNGIPTVVDVTSLITPTLNRITLTFSDTLVAASGHFHFLLENGGADDPRAMQGFITTVEGNRVHHQFATVPHTDIVQACMVLLTEVASDRKVTRLVDIECRHGH